MEQWSYLTIAVMFLAALEPIQATGAYTASTEVPVAAGVVAGLEPDGTGGRHVLAAADPGPHDKGKRSPEEDDPSDEAADPGAEEESLNVYDRLEIREREDNLMGISRAASEGSTGYRDLQMRPITRTGELLETTPGMVAT